jgi:hypothetical protein
MNIKASEESKIANEHISTTLMMKTEIVLETSVSTKAEPHYPAENPKDLLQENSLVRRENIKMPIHFK